MAEKYHELTLSVDTTDKKTYPEFFFIIKNQQPLQEEILLRKSFLFGLFILFIALTTGCNSAKSTFKPGAAGEISVLSLRGNTSDMTQDQIAELKRVGTWMDRDIIKQLNRAGYTAKLLKSRSDFSGPGHLLIIDVDKFNPGNRAARAFVGFGAGSSSLDLNYQLLDSQKKMVSEWKDGVGSSKGGTYCAQTLNRNAIKQLQSKL